MMFIITGLFLIVPDILYIDGFASSERYKPLRQIKILNKICILFFTYKYAVQNKRMTVKVFFISSVIVLIFLIDTGCSTSRKTGVREIRTEMESTRDLMSRKKRNVSLIKNRKAGETGFYYIIDLKGTILSHPRGLLVGSSFRRYNFVKKIIELRSGCIRYDAGELQQLVFFMPLTEESILCLSIPADEVIKSEDACRRVKP